MRRVWKSVEAEHDLVDIWEYTFDEWDENQADQYLFAVDAGFERIKTNPMTGRSREQFGVGLRSFQIGHHVVFNMIGDSTITIVRVLHERMDVTSNVQYRDMMTDVRIVLA